MEDIFRVYYMADSSTKELFYSDLCLKFPSANLEILKAHSIKTISIFENGIKIAVISRLQKE